MRLALIGSDGLLASAQQLATDFDPWLERLECNYEDFIAAGGRGDSLRLAIPRPMVGHADMFRRFTHPLSRARLSEMAAEAKASCHVVDLIPSHDVQRGWIQG